MPALYHYPHPPARCVLDLVVVKLPLSLRSKPAEFCCLSPVYTRGIPYGLKIQNLCHLELDRRAVGYRSQA